MARSILILLALFAILVAWWGLAATDMCDQFPEGQEREVCYVEQEGG